MAIWDKLKPYYEITVTCFNCGLKSNIKVPKGITVKSFAKHKLGKCSHCGCILEINEYQTQWLE